MARNVLLYSTSIPRPMHGVAVSLFHLSLNAVALHAPLLGCVGTDSARILTQTCDIIITMKDEYIYIYLRERERSICRDLILLKN